MEEKIHALASKYFNDVLEVGAGTGAHIQAVRHGFGSCVLSDLNPPFGYTPDQQLRATDR